MACDQSRISRCRQKKKYQWNGEPTGWTCGNNATMMSYMWHKEFDHVRIFWEELVVRFGTTAEQVKWLKSLHIRMHSIQMVAFLWINFIIHTCASTQRADMRKLKKNLKSTWCGSQIEKICIWYYITRWKFRKNVRSSQELEANGMPYTLHTTSHSSNYWIKLDICTYKL